MSEFFGVILMLLMVFGIPFLIIRSVYKFYTRTHKFSDNSEQFQQAGVIVNYTKGTIQIGKYFYNVSQVTGLSTITDNAGAMGGRRVLVNIEVADMNKPVHPILVTGQEPGDAFVRRLSMALSKAGGPNFL